MKVRHDGFDLRVVEDHAVRFVSHEAVSPQWVFAEEHIRGDMDQLGYLAEAASYSQKHLVPGDTLVARDVERLADRLGIAEQAHEPDGEILVMGEGP